VTNQYAEYIKNVKRNQANKRLRLEQIRQKAWDYARKMADLLYDKYNATGVYLFGSVLDKGSFNEDSDIDILVFGLGDKDYFQAVNDLDDLMHSEFGLDLVCGESCKESVLQLIMERSIKIAKEGRHQEAHQGNR